MTDLTLADIRRRWPAACEPGLRWLADNWPAGQETWTLGEALAAGCEISHAVWLAVRLDDAHRRAVAAWAADCAERVLPIYEAAHPGDPSPREAIEAVREGRGARARASAASAAAARAAGAATYAAASAAASAARANAVADARAAADAAAYAAAFADASAARKAERAWQRDRLIERLAEIEAMEPADG